LQQKNERFKYEDLMKAIAAPVERAGFIGVNLSEVNFTLAALVQESALS